MWTGDKGMKEGGRWDGGEIGERGEIMGGGEEGWGKGGWVGDGEGG